MASVIKITDYQDSEEILWGDRWNGSGPWLSGAAAIGGYAGPGPIIAAPEGDDLFAASLSPAASGVPTKDENGSGDGTASVAASGDQRIDGLLSAVRWADGFITYSDPDAAADYQAGHPEAFTNFQQINANQLLAAHAVLNQAIYTQPSGGTGFSVEGFTNLAIDYAGSGTGAGTIRLANTSNPGTAYAYYPSGGSSGGDVFFGPSGRSPTTGNYDYFTVIHELGHSLGLKHGHETGTYGALPSATDSMEYSLMTYRSYVGSDAQAVYNEQWGYAQTFMMYDIAALQYMYGADFTSNGGDTTYTWDPNTGESYVDGVLALDPGGNRIFQTIWDGNGVDTYDLSNYSTNVTIDLGPGDFSVFSTAQLAYLGGGPNGGYARGNVFNALQFQGDARSLIERAEGGSGNDNIYGNAAVNTLLGNGGNDIFVGNGGADRFYGDSGNDLFYVDSNDRAYDSLGRGYDVVRASYSHSLASGQEIELLATRGIATTNTINLIGNAYDQTLQGNAGNNRIDGRGEVDIISTYGGTDTVDFSTPISTSTRDIIRDFSHVNDTFRLSKGVFTVIPTGDLTESRFKDIGDGATVDSSDRIIYNHDNGQLFYDRDGSGSTYGQVQFATLTNKTTTLDYTDFTVFA